MMDFYGNMDLDAELALVKAEIAHCDAKTAYFTARKSFYQHRLAVLTETLADQGQFEPWDGFMGADSGDDETGGREKGYQPGTGIESMIVIDEDEVTGIALDPREYPDLSLG